MNVADLNEGSSEADDERKSTCKRVKLPNKRRHQMEMNHYSDLIQKKEAILKSLNVSKSRKSTSSVQGSREELLAKLRSLGHEKEQKLKQKQVIDVEIKSLNQQVVKKNETCMKLQANVKYKDEHRFNNAIKNLERTLSTRQLKLREEKKLVSEIDALKRSKKTLSEYMSAKHEVDQLRQRQSRLRSERDTLIRETHNIKACENDVKVSLDSLKEGTEITDSGENTPTIDKDALKKEIDSLYEKRRELDESYKQARTSYYEEQKEYEKNLQQIKAEQRRDESRLTKITADRARQEQRQEPEPYEDERNICVCLIQYLEPLIAQCSGDNDEVDPGNKASPRYLDVPAEGSLIKKKDEDDNLGGLFVQSNRRMTRKGSRKGRKSKDSGQKLVLHPHVFEQFFKLNLEPPSTYADVNGILEKLKAKKETYEKAFSGKPTQLMPIILESLPSTERFSDSELVKNETKNVLTSTQLAKDSPWHGKDMAKHEVDKVQHELDTVQCEVVNNEQETQQNEHDVRQVEHELKPPLHELKMAEHEPTQHKHKSIYLENKSEEKERESVKESHESDQKNIFENEQESCHDKQIATENILNKAEDQDMLSSLSMNCSSIISDTLEKGIDCLNMKESSKEIQVRVT